MGAYYLLSEGLFIKLFSAFLVNVVGSCFESNM